MRNKIKQMMQKEEGFTLVELLAVIVILGIIVAIAIPAIGNVISDATDDANDAEYAMIEDAARLWDVDTDNTIPADGISVPDLISAGYLDVNDPADYADTDVVKKTEITEDVNGTATGTGAYEYVYSGRPAE